MITFRTLRILAAIAAISAAPVSAQAGDSFERAGDIAQIGLPVAAAVCAARQGRLGDFAGDFALQSVVVHGLKLGLGESSINRRPNGSYKGFPSGHTATAVAGAADLARHCFKGNKLASGLLYGTAAAVGVSRITSDHHNVGQVAAGALIGYSAGKVTFSAGKGVFGVRIGFDF